MISEGSGDTELYLNRKKLFEIVVIFYNMTVFTVFLSWWAKWTTFTNINKSYQPQTSESRAF